MEGKRGLRGARHWEPAGQLPALTAGKVAGRAALPGAPQPRQHPPTAHFPATVALRRCPSRAHEWSGRGCPRPRGAAIGRGSPSKPRPPRWALYNWRGGARAGLSARRVPSSPVASQRSSP